MRPVFRDVSVLAAIAAMVLLGIYGVSLVKEATEPQAAAESRCDHLVPEGLADSHERQECIKHSEPSATPLAAGLVVGGIALATGVASRNQEENE